MNDRELLELAAKAAEIDGLYFVGYNPIHTGIFRAAHDYYWNPLISDSEALRLMVKLNMTVQCSYASVWVECPVPEIEIVENHNNKDPLSATRRAIVRAAAEIGRSM